MKSCFFTGHRNIKITDELSAKLTNELIKLIESGVSCFYAGGAVGWDMLCEKKVIELKKLYPHIKLHLLLPCPHKQQTEKWDKKQISEFYKLLKAADSSEILSNEYTEDCMKKRNLKLAESSEVALCYCNKNRRRSGTSQTVIMAEKRGVKIINLYY